MRPLALLVALAGCTPPGPGARTEVILETLAIDNERWAAREPELLAGKYRLMQAEEYDWLRGTAALYWRDLTAPGATPTAFGDGASARVLLVGDPHPENLGTFRSATGSAFVDWNDLDFAGHGPYWGDVRRWALACAVAAGVDEMTAYRLGREAGLAYADEITSGGDGALTADAHPLIEDALGDAAEDGATAALLERYAPVVDGARRLVRGDLDPRNDAGDAVDSLVGVGDDRPMVEAMVEAWRVQASPDAGEVLDLARRLGAGVASYATPRYYALLAGPTPAPNDDLLLEFKEVADGVRPQGLPERDAAAWASPAARVVSAQRALAARPGGDPWLGVGDVPGRSMKVRERTGYQRNLDAGDLADLAVDDPAALPALVAAGARRLAGAHGAARTRDGLRGRDVIAPRLRGVAGAFADEVGSAAAADLVQLRADFDAVADLDLLAATRW